MSDATPYVRADVRAFLDFFAAAGQAPLEDTSIEEARAVMHTLQDMAERDARTLPVIRDLTCPGPDGEIPLRLYDSREQRSEPCNAVMFFHGGGFVIGDIESHHRLCTEIASQLDLPVISVDYRLAPEAPFPAAPDDCEAASRWVASSPGDLALDVSGLITMGDSAGGNLAIVVAQSLADEPADVPVVLQAPIYPLTDDISANPSYQQFSDGYLLTADSMDFFFDAYAAPDDDIRYRPILGNHAVAPPTVICTAGLDPLRDSGRNYASRLIQAGIKVAYLEMDGNIHGFANLRKALPMAQKDTTDFLNAVKLMLVAGQ